MKVIYPPDPLTDWSGFQVFLAGSIEQGKAANWQQTLIKGFSRYPDDLVLLNPRRLDWDSSWEQSVHNPQFKAQVRWELSHLENASLAVFYFDPETKAPITLMELGFIVGRDEVPCVVCCPFGYWRRGNIEVFCDKFKIPLLSSLEELYEHIRSAFNEEMETLADQLKYWQDLRNGV